MNRERPELDRLRAICLELPEVSEHREDAYRKVAPKKLVALPDGGCPAATPDKLSHVNRRWWL